MEFIPWAETKHILICNTGGHIDCIFDLLLFQRAKREVDRFAHKMVTSKQAWNEISKMRQTEQMMDGEWSEILDGLCRKNNTVIHTLD